MTDKSYPYALPAGTLLHGNAYTYEVTRVLGQGSFGITYETKVRLSGALGELASDVTVTVKEFFMRDVNGRDGSTVTTGGDSEIFHNYRNDFAREARNLSRLKHPRIVKVLEAFEANNTSYFAMEYIGGGNFDEYISSQGALTEYEALTCIDEIGEALAYMHSCNMLHLDLKPGNIMRRESGELVLIDFGLSKQFSSDGNPETSTRIGGGTRGYAPLEQANFRKGEGFPATLDIYALGATLFKTLTGHSPDSASDIYNNGFPADELQSRGISDDIIKLISWAMEPRKRNRPQTVGEFLQAVHRIMPSASKTRHSAGQGSAGTRGHSSEPTTKPFFINKYEECNVFRINWANDVPNRQKKKIRDLLNRMRKIGEHKEAHYDEYGENFVTTYPVMASIAPINNRDFSISFDEEYSAVDGFFESIKCAYLIEAVNLLLKLEQQTGLQFRLPTQDEAKRINPQFYHDKLFYNKLLLYSPNIGFSYIDSNKVIHDVDIHDFFDTFLIHIVCDRTKPAVNGRGFDISWTQPIFDEIRPIGFGFYKVRTGDTWNITTHLEPTGVYLPQSYEKISNIGIQTIPAPGYVPISNSFFGIIAENKDSVACYELKNRQFILKTEMSRAKWDRLSQLT